jgi:hypothetical protein
MRLGRGFFPLPGSFRFHRGRSGRGSFPLIVTPPKNPRNYLLKFVFCSDKMFGMNSGAGKISPPVQLRTNRAVLRNAEFSPAKALIAAIFTKRGRKNSKNGEFWDILRHLLPGNVSIPVRSPAAIPMTAGAPPRGKWGIRRYFGLCSTALRSAALTPPRGDMRHYVAFCEFYRKIVWELSPAIRLISQSGRYESRATRANEKTLGGARTMRMIRLDATRTLRLNRRCCKMEVSQIRLVN